MKEKLIIISMIMIICFTFIFVTLVYYNSKIVLENNQNKENNFIENVANNNNNNNNVDVVIIDENESNVILKQEIDDWRLTLVNFENNIPEDFEISLSNIDATRQFDSRAIDFLKEMLVQMKKDGVKGAWVQSAYRSIDYQNQLFEEKVQEYIKLGFTEEEAEKETLKLINKPETSEHNIGLAIDFNYVNTEFENTKAFKWLIENAENYGFILRYQKEKEDITKVSYEPWHWRFVGIEHAKKINELNMCLEEYVEYLKIKQ